MIEVTISKPVYGSFCYISDKYIRQARATGQKLKIRCPQGEGIFTADEWLQGSKKMSKVFLIKDKPMILYGNHVVRKLQVETMKQLSFL